MELLSKQRQRKEPMQVRLKTDFRVLPKDKKYPHQILRTRLSSVPFKLSLLLSKNNLMQQ